MATPKAPKARPAPHAEPPVVTYRRTVAAMLAHIGHDPRLVADAVDLLFAGGEEANPGGLTSLVMRSLPDRDAFADNVVDADAIDQKTDPCARWKREDWEAAQDNFAWYTVYVDAMHGCAVAADLRRGGVL